MLIQCSNYHYVFAFFGRQKYFYSEADQVGKPVDYFASHEQGRVPNKDLKLNSWKSGLMKKYHLLS